MKHRLLLALLLAVPLLAQGSVAPLALPAPPSVAVTQQPGAELPLDLVLSDEDDRPVRFAGFFDGRRPVLLVLGYYRCPQLCGLLMHGLLESLQASGVPRADWRIVGVSIDPQDTPATARTRRASDLAYAAFLQDGAPAAAPDLHLLTAAPQDVRDLAARVGFGFEAAAPAEPGVAGAAFAHPATVVVATPNGRISRYLMGVQFEPAETRLALAEAAGDRIGALTTRIALLCAHFDPRVGRHDGAVMNAARVLGLGVAAALAAWCWRRRGRHGRAA